jgi:hypothetical protein
MHILYMTDDEGLLAKYYVHQTDCVHDILRREKPIRQSIEYL